MKITIKNYRCPSWNTLYAGTHWTTRTEMADIAHALVHEALGTSYTMYTNPVDIHITAYLKRPIDSDNITSKLIIDGLKGKVIKDDSIKYVRRVTTEAVKSKEDYTVIEISPVSI